MKKITFITATLLGLIGTTLVGQANANADTQTTNTEANVTIISGGLNLDTLGKMDFQDITLNGQDQTAGPSEPDKDILTLHDYRGTTSGWKVQASFKQDAVLGGGMTLNLAPTANQGKKTIHISLSSEPQDIVILDTADTTKPDTKITLNPTITVPAKTMANTYNATIVWNTVDGSPV